MKREYWYFTRIEGSAGYVEPFLKESIGGFEVKNMERFMLSIEKLMSCSKECYAHLSPKGGEKETLCAHTELSQKYWIRIFRKKHIYSIIKNFEEKYFESLSEEAGTLFEKMTMNIVTFHDFGKVNPLFQKKKMQKEFHPDLAPDNNIGSKHSILSAAFYLDYFLDEINASLSDKDEGKILKDFAYIYSYIISRHHGELVELKQYLESLAGNATDGGTLGNRALKWMEKWKKEMEGKENFPKFIKRPDNVLSRNGLGEDKKGIYLYGLTRLLYSILLASDYYATSEYMKGVEIKDFGEVDKCSEIINIYEQGDVQKSIRNYEKTNYHQSSKSLKDEKDINILRTEMFLDAEYELKKNMDASVFYLEAPTGSGKSNTAMNLSFKLMEQNEYIRKIFYIYPFNTLVEQNMDSIGKVFGENEDIMKQVAVVNSLEPLKEKADEDEWSVKEDSERYQKILLDRQFLNYPIVLSTHVMLFRTMFGHYKEDAFGFYQLCNSVIVLDEIQSYNNSLWAEIIAFFKGFAELMNIKIIIMSATLPNLEMLTENNAKTVGLIKDREKYFAHPLFSERVVANYELLDKQITMDELKAHVFGSIENEKKILIEFIKKVSAEEFYKAIKDGSEYPVFLMTGDSSIQDRKKIIEKTKELKYVILIATQVIEAGVDIDMDIGYKDISKLDSEEQFMGRINRSSKREGTVYFFNMDDAAGVYTDGDDRVQEKYTLKEASMRNILTTKDFPEFYREYILPAIKRKGEKLTSQNLKFFFHKIVKELDIPAIDKRMKLIDDSRNMISVYLARTLINENNETVDGHDIWENYKLLLEDDKLEYAEKTVKLRNIRPEMNSFIYQLSEKQFKEKDYFQADERIGDIYYMENGEEYFDENGILKKEMFDNSDLFI